MRNLWGRTIVALSACALAVGFIATSSVAAGASAHHPMPRPKPRGVSSLCHFTSAQPQISQGSTGIAVKQAQCELNWAYAYGHSTNYGNGPYGGLTEDGDFGPLTNAATHNFQSCVHIASDGIIGPDTWAELNYWVNQPGYACG